MSLQSCLFSGDGKLEAAAKANAGHITPGATGAHVAKIQWAVITLDNAVIDRAELQSRRYGPSTAKAVLDYKRKRKIINTSYQQSADNVVGIMTMRALDDELTLRERFPPLRTGHLSRVRRDPSYR